MRLELTPQEQEDLLWRAGDAYEIVRGDVTKTTGAPMPTPHSAYTHLVFFFDSQELGSKEWRISVAGGEGVQNGPALLMLYRRANAKDAYPFGIISLTNRAWTHTAPLDIFKPFRSSAPYRGMIVWSIVRLLINLLLLTAVWYGCVQFVTWPARPALPDPVLTTLGLVGLAGPAVIFVAAMVYMSLYMFNPSALLRFANEKKLWRMHETARSLMHRVSQSIDKYVPTARSGRRGSL